MYLGSMVQLTSLADTKKKRKKDKNIESFPKFLGIFFSPQSISEYLLPLSEDTT